MAIVPHIVYKNQGKNILSDRLVNKRGFLHEKVYVSYPWSLDHLAVAAPPTTLFSLSKYALSRADLMATQLNTRVILRGVGKWLGNIDVAMRIVKSFQNQYFLQGFVDLFDEYKSLTISLTRIL
ncbi:hypothetical protein F5878DRAFT_699907 [Lentinula raphanica]|uniref:Uncharacterized protein n=1 Tax=Lentinula raphanica TaxID=153919 RepID=A0AA38UCF3_9AGAR|nr:hypothetical protein F5878DRAFT_699907 [Lentinula raphanica]